MIKAEIRSIFRNLLPKYDKTNRWHDRMIDAGVEKVLGEMYNDCFKRNPLELQRYVKQYGYTTALPILLENSTGLYYTTLPAAIHPFSDKASGVRRVSTLVQGGLTFFPMDARETDLVLSGSNVDTVTAKIGYIVTPTRVEYYNMSGLVSGQGVRMDLIVPFSVYLDTDTVLIPEETDQQTSQRYATQGATFIDRVLKILGVVQATDLRDDNSDPVEKQQNNRQ